MTGKPKHMTHEQETKNFLPADHPDDKPPYQFDDDAAEDMFGDDWCPTCHNTGYIECYCGGDNCVCGNNGEMPCPRCG